MVTEVTTRRTFLSGVFALGVAPTASWADAGSPGFLAAAQVADGSYRLFGLDRGGHEVLSIPLPARGHAAAAHPQRPEAVAFARRPGTYAIVLDCRDGRVIQRLAAPEGRHFYGHGCFSGDGSVLYTAENAYESGEGRIGLWAAGDGYGRLGEIPSGGIGPHDVARLPGEETLVVANGGIRTHPDTGRTKLNLPTMRPNLCYLAPSGEILQCVELDPHLRLNSIRHLAVRPDGLVAFAMQWEGPATEAPPLLGLHRRGGARPSLLSAPPVEQRGLHGYAGSVAFSGAGDLVGITAPRGNRAQLFDPESLELRSMPSRADICGLAPSSDGLAATDGNGAFLAIGDERSDVLTSLRDRRWDNHLVAVRQ